MTTTMEQQAESLDVEKLVGDVESVVDVEKLVGDLESVVDVEKLLVAAPEQVAVILLLPRPSLGRPAENTAIGRKHWTKMKVVPFAVLTVVQFLISANQILSRVALVAGINPRFLSFYRNLVAFLFLAPVAFFVDREVRPKMTLSTFKSLNLLAFFGILGSQQMFLLGLKLTSPLFAAVMQNMVPVITFLLAALVGMEKVSLRKRSDHVRIFGTVICISGAVAIILYKGMAIFPKRTHQEGFHGFISMIVDLPQLGTLEKAQWSVGMMCLLIHCISWAFYLISQGAVLERYPALLSMAAMMEFLGSMQVGIVAIAYEGIQCLDFRLVTKDQLVIILYGGIVASSINFVLLAWCLQRVGPFIASLFNPIQTLIVAALAILILGETLYMGILIGAVLIIAGFYLVVYGQRMEKRSRRQASPLEGSSEARVSLGDRKRSGLEEALLS